jgi:hypothetical protein
MSRVRSSSQGGKAVPSSLHPQLTLEEMRHRMLNRQALDIQQLNRADLEAASGPDRPPTGNKPLFVGRSLVLSNSPPHPSSTAHDASDPHKLFQMLRRKKKSTTVATAAQDRAPITPTSVVRHSPDRSEPHPAMEPDSPQADIRPVPPSAEVPPRPLAAHRPMVAPYARYSFSAGGNAPPTKRGPTPRESTSAHAPPHAAPDGRPATRQKLPTQSLDLFPESDKKPAGPVPAGAQSLGDDPFPKPAGRRSAGRNRNQSSNGGSNGGSSDAKKASDVNFNCLFVTNETELGGSDEFPAPRTNASIPLIETDWFSEKDTWEAIPADNDETSTADLAEDSSQTLYELLVAQKGRRSAKRATAAAAAAAANP